MGAKYANLTSRSLIKYRDYPNRAEATIDFGQHSNYFYYGPNSLIPDAKVLLRPSWYYPATPGRGYSRCGFSKKNACDRVGSFQPGT